MGLFEHAFRLGWEQDYPTPAMMGVDPNLEKLPGYALPPAHLLQAGRGQTLF
jgi:hypothetical protein